MRKRRIEIEPEFFELLVCMYMNWQEKQEEKYNQNGKITDRRHKLKSREDALRYAFIESQQIEKVRRLLLQTKIINEEDYEMPWVFNDYDNLSHSKPVGYVSNLAIEGHLLDYFDELMEKKEIEVVGNIHENLKILKEENG